MAELIDELTRAIAGAFPALRIETARLAVTGQNNDVLIVNDRLVFRFPRYAGAVAQMKAEAAVLRALKGRAPVAVPDPAYSRLDCGDGERAFMGYELIAGEPLPRQTLGTMVAARLAADEVASQLASFLRVLHSTPLDPLRDLLPWDDGLTKWAEMYSRIRELLFPHMRADARAAVSAHFESYLVDAGPQGSSALSPSLVHGDFGSGNILFDRETGRVTGVIDFGSAGIGDPATDIAALSSGFGESFVRLVLERYPLGDDVLRRVTFYRGTFALQEALFGIENGDNEAFAAGMAQYR